MDHGPDKEALGVGDDMLRPAFDLLSRVIAPWPATLGGLLWLKITPALRPGHRSAGKDGSHRRRAAGPHGRNTVAADQAGPKRRPGRIDLIHQCP